MTLPGSNVAPEAAALEVGEPLDAGLLAPPADTLGVGAGPAEPATGADDGGPWPQAETTTSAAARSPIGRGGKTIDPSYGRGSAMVPGRCYAREMDAFELADLVADREASGRPYLEFLAVPDLSVGLYVLKAGDPDLQQPHTEDEVYYVIDGRGRITVGDEVRDVRRGSVVFVGTAVPHRFHDITEDLTLLVAFGPAEGSRAAG